MALVTPSWRTRDLADADGLSAFIGVSACPAHPSCVIFASHKFYFGKALDQALQEVGIICG